MYKVTKQLSNWCMAHRLGKGYEGKCVNLHGHNYKCSVTLSAKKLNAVDMVLDFGVIKELFDRWIQDHWDHACMVQASDHTLLTFLQRENNNFYIIDVEKEFKGANTTAEVMSKLLYKKFKTVLKRNDIKGINVVKVRVWETDSSYATYEE